MITVPAAENGTIGFRVETSIALHFFNFNWICSEWHQLFCFKPLGVGDSAEQVLLLCALHDGYKFTSALHCDGKN
jgi:hypothetical protein